MITKVSAWPACVFTDLPEEDLYKPHRINFSEKIFNKTHWFDITYIRGIKEELSNSVTCWITRCISASLIFNTCRWNYALNMMKSVCTTLQQCSVCTCHQRQSLFKKGLPGSIFPFAVQWQFIHTISNPIQKPNIQLCAHV